MDIKELEIDVVGKDVNGVDAVDRDVEKSEFWGHQDVSSGAKSNNRNNDAQSVDNVQEYLVKEENHLVLY